MLYLNNEERSPVCSSTLVDMITGESVRINSPEEFTLETVLVNSAYYVTHAKEYRFMLAQARVAGLKIEKPGL